MEVKKFFIIKNFELDPCFHRAHLVKHPVQYIVIVSLGDIFAAIMSYRDFDILSSSPPNNDFWTVFTCSTGQQVMGMFFLWLQS